MKTEVSSFQMPTLSVLSRPFLRTLLAEGRYSTSDTGRETYPSCSPGLIQAHRRELIMVTVIFLPINQFEMLLS